MSAALSWYVAVQSLGLLAFLITAPFLRALPDAGYASSKALGVLLFGMLLWVGTALGLLRNEPGGALLVFMLAGAAALAQFARQRQAQATGAPRAWPARHVIIATELLFLAAFAGWCLVRFTDPAANHTEQPMDLMLLTAVSATPVFPVGDPWLAGFPVGYYYLGYWLMSSIGLLAAIEPSVAYNVGQASWFGLLICTCFGIGYNLAALGETPSRPSTTGMTAGGLAAVSVGLASNLHLPVEWIAARWHGDAQGLAGHWWWWRSSRAVRDLDLAGQPIEIITEFPFFSYLLGDNHPHLLAMPFVALIVSLSLALLLNGRTHAASASRPAAMDPRLGPGMLLAVTCAALVAMNSWDFPAAFLLGLVALLLPLFRESKIPIEARQSASRLLTAALLLIVVLTVPYVLTAQSQLQGVLPNLFHPTSLFQFATVFGALAPGVVLLLWLAWRARPPSERHLLLGFASGLGACAIWLVLGGYWAWHSAAGGAWLARIAAEATDPLGVALDRWLTGWPVLAIAVGGLAVTVSLLWPRARSIEDAPPGITVGLALTALGLLLVLAPEIVYVHDNFGTRMNTVFKFYYQAWLYLALAGALGIVLAWRQGGGLRAGAVGSSMVLLMALVYAPAAVWTKTQEGRAASGSFDALDYLRRERPDEHAAVTWVRANTRPGAIITQAPGNSYDVAHSLISVATARPTLLGWEGHERQWRGPSFDAMAAGRHDALARIYAPESDSDLQQTLLTWDVMFVYVGPVERARYGLAAGHEARLGRTMDLVFEQGEIRIYRRRN